MEYWKECIEASFSDHGIVATVEQIERIAGDVQVAHENYGMAYYIPSGGESPEAKELKEIKAAMKKHEDWVNSTKPCKRCTTTGIVLDVWGRTQTCPNCDGNGRV